jgi:hypothetical protein
MSLYVTNIDNKTQFKVPSENAWYVLNDDEKSTGHFSTSKTKKWACRMTGDDWGEDSLITLGGIRQKMPEETHKI